MTAVPLDPIQSRHCQLEHHFDCLERHCGCSCHFAEPAGVPNLLTRLTGLLRRGGTR